MYQRDSVPKHKAYVLKVTHSSIHIQRFSINNSRQVTLLFWNQLSFARAMAQAVSSRPLTAETQLLALANSGGICGQSGTGTAFSPSSSVLPC
jgi:hypothetical protein